MRIETGLQGIYNYTRKPDAEIGIEGTYMRMSGSDRNLDQAGFRIDAL